MGAQRWVQGNSLETGPPQGGVSYPSPAERVGREGEAKARVGGFSYNSHPDARCTRIDPPRKGEGEEAGADSHGSFTNLKLPAALSVCASKVRISTVPPTSIVTTSR